MRSLRREWLEFCVVDRGAAFRRLLSPADRDDYQQRKRMEEEGEAVGLIGGLRTTHLVHLFKNNWLLKCPSVLSFSFLKH